MNNLKKVFKNKKVIIGIIIVILLVGGVSGYFIYDNNRKNEILEKISIAFTDTKEIEYGTEDFDVQKELVKSIDNAELTEVPKLDTTKIGEVTLTFNLKKDDVAKTIEHKVKVVDTKGPEIVLEADSKELTVGDEYDIKTNITSVKDVIDGDIALNEDASEINEKATEEYIEVKKDEVVFKDVNGEATFADHKLDDFFIETTKGEDENEEETMTLYLKNCYYVDGSVDTATAGEYKINVIAVDKNGVKSTKEFVVMVKEKEVEKSPATLNNGGDSTSGGRGNSSSSGGGNNTVKGSIQDVINTAKAQVGKPYVAGGRGPNSFDCYGLVLYAFNQNGYNITDLYNAGKSVGNDISTAQAGDIIITPNHVRLYLGGMNSAQAMNPSQGIRSGYDQQIAGYFQWKVGDPNFSEDPLKVIDIRRVR